MNINDTQKKEYQNGTKEKVKQEEQKHELEFGGPVGAAIFICWSHYILYYFWFCMDRNEGQLYFPPSFSPSGIYQFGANIIGHIQQNGIPTLFIFCCYVTFIISQLFLASFMPGLTIQGLPLKNKKDKKLPYLCNAYSSYYLSLFILFLLNYLKIIRLSFIYDNLGMFLTSAIIFSNITVIVIFVSAKLLNDESKLSDYLIYNIFMGNQLNPRIGILDIKMIAEVRLSWLLLFLITTSTAFKQYETTGTVSIQTWFMIYAHWLYSNACAKGEHFIPTTWDMTHENFGWMLNFWNLAGVPFLYCLQSLYVHKYPDTSIPTHCIIFNFILISFAYYLFDTQNLQHADWRMRERGVIINRFTFPIFPWARLTNPKLLQTPYGSLVIDGYYKYARKLNYTADILMALSWGLNCGFTSFIPYFYVCFFTGMIIHRQQRDEKRCSNKYKEYWQQYKKFCPYVFIPKII